MTRLTAQTLLLGVALGFGCNAERSGDAPLGDNLVADIVESTGPTGRIRGTVRFEGALEAAEFEAITENQNVCGDSAPLQRLALGENLGVRHAFVYLEGVPPIGSAIDRPSASTEPVLVDQRECEYVPHALVVPVETRAAVTNSDAILHNVHGRRDTGDGLQTIFNLAQPLRGQRTTINSPLTEPGIVYLSCEAGHPWMSAHILVADHAYVAVTDGAGEFLIDNVPPGTYDIKMWHEGVRLERIVRSLQRYDYEEPYEITQEVTVEADTETLVAFQMTLRPKS